MEKGTISEWVEQRKLRGYYSFTFTDVKESFEYMANHVISTSLSRLVRNKTIISPAHGFYIIIPTEYALTGLVPAVFYIGEMMKFLGRNYYVGLLNAAAFYGAAHQRPQSFAVMNDGVSLRDGVRAGIRFYFVRKKEIPEKYVTRRKGRLTEIKVSSPELTTIDLIAYQSKVGGLNRVCSVLNELCDSLKLENADDDFFVIYGLPVYQRLGYILDQVLGNTELADDLYHRMDKLGLTSGFRRVPFKVGKSVEDCKTDPRWKVIENQEIEIDE